MGEDRRQVGGRPSVRRLVKGPRRELVTEMRLVATEPRRGRKAGSPRSLSINPTGLVFDWTWDYTAARARFGSPVSLAVWG